MDSGPPALARRLNRTKIPTEDVTDPRIQIDWDPNPEHSYLVGVFFPDQFVTGKLTLKLKTKQAGTGEQRT